MPCNDVQSTAVPFFLTILAESQLRLGRHKWILVEQAEEQVGMVHVGLSLRSFGALCVVMDIG
jgi:hypothetical protein